MSSSRFAIVLLLIAGGCAGSSLPVTSPRPVDEDLVSLLPSGADAILDIDMPQLDEWAPAERLLRLLPEEAKRRLAGLGLNPLQAIDQLVLSLSGLGKESPAATLLLTASKDLGQSRFGLSEDAVESDYRGATLLEEGVQALGRVTAHLVALGDGVAVRRSLDLAHGNGESVRSAREDRELVTALGHVPTAKLGRPAIRAALVPTDALRAALRDSDLPGAELKWLAIALAVGDGFDLGVVAEAHDADEAAALVKRAKATLEGWKRRRSVQLLGLRPFFDPLIIVGHEAEIHLAYRLSEHRVEELIKRMEAIARLGKEKS